MRLKPLEFTECITDSPLFREKLHAHEKELEETSHQMKRLIKELKDLLIAAQNLSRAQRTLSNTLKNFKFELIGDSITEDESVISQSFAEFGKLIDTIEDERGRMLDDEGRLKWCFFEYHKKPEKVYLEVLPCSA